MNDVGNLPSGLKQLEIMVAEQMPEQKSLKKQWGVNFHS